MEILRDTGRDKSHKIYYLLLTKAWFSMSTTVKLGIRTEIEVRV